MISLPIPIVIAQWALLVGAILLIIVIYRQLAFILHEENSRLAPSGLPAGTLAPSFTYLPSRSTLTGPQDGANQFPPVGEAAVLLFVDPQCPSCTDLLTALREFRSMPAFKDLLFLPVTSANSEFPPAVTRTRFPATPIGKVSRDVMSDYHAPATPYAYTINRAGKIVEGKAPRGRSEVAQMLQDLLHADEAIISVKGSRLNSD